MASINALLDEYFGFLEAEYGLRIVHEYTDKWGYKRIYANKTIAIKIYWETRPLDETLMVSFLPMKGRDAAELANAHHWEALWPLYILRAPHIQYQETYDQKGRISIEAYMRNLVAVNAKLLQEYGQDLLSGKFSILPKMRKALENYDRKLLPEDQALLDKYFALREKEKNIKQS